MRHELGARGAIEAKERVGFYSMNEELANDATVPVVTRTLKAA